MINRFFQFGFFAPLFSTCLYSSPYQAGIHTIPLLSTTSKERLEWMDRAQECVDQRENKGTFKMKGMILFYLEENQRTGGKMEKWDERRHEMHSFTLALSHSLSFVFSFFSLSVPRGLGVSCNLSIGFSLAYPVTCSPSYLFVFLPDHFSFHFHVSLPHLSLLLSCSSLCWFSWAYYQCVCSVFVTGQLGRKEGRLMATEILSDSGPVQAVPMGSMCFLPQWNAREHPSTVLTLSTAA